MHQNHFKSLIIVLMVCFTACKKDKPASRVDSAPLIRKGVYVVCEGQYTVGNGSLYLYQPTKDSVFGDVYRSVNGTSIGDVFQSMTYVKGHFYCCINNSGRVVVADTGTLKAVATIPVAYPRYFLPISQTFAYLSVLYNNKVYQINLASNTIVDSISLPSLNAEVMCVANNQLFVASWDTSVSWIYRIEMGTNRIIQTIETGGYAAHDILVDSHQMLWVLSGNQAKGRSSQLTQIDPSTGAILKKIVFPKEAEPIKPVFNRTRDTLYFLAVNYYGGTQFNGAYRIGIKETTLPTEPFVAAKQYQYFWAIGIEPTTGDVYLGDPKGFNQNGQVLVYTTNGKLKTTFTVGVGPSSFVFF